MRGDLGSLVGKDVEVMANGTVYRGRLIEVGIEEVYLRADTRWITIMTSAVSEIHEIHSSETVDR
ncbi:MAG: hypothetical protein JW885_15260 [Deltaproteobacteria bacterium]|nr:hypothetical protein [Candidatus Zymogenaceae bacterium]